MQKKIRVNMEGRFKGRNLTWSNSFMRNKLFEFLFFAAAECIYSENQDIIKKQEKKNYHCSQKLRNSEEF
jgi:hypothetical protein